MTETIWDIVAWMFIVGSWYGTVLLFRDLYKFIRNKYVAVGRERTMACSHVWKRRKGGIFFCRKATKERDKCWRRRINAIYDDCTTDWGTTDFELVAERILDLLKETE